MCCGPGMTSHIPPAQTPAADPRGRLAVLGFVAVMLLLLGVTTTTVLGGQLLALTEAVVATKRLSQPNCDITVNGHPIKTLVDSDRYTQVLDNLLDNAVHAAGPHAAITVRVAAADHSVRVDVTDNGPGLCQQDTERIFDRLVRIDTSRAAHTGGFGLGLPIARGIARAHGGDLVCLPRDGTGAHFRLTLPLPPLTDDAVHEPVVDDVLSSRSHH